MFVKVISLAPPRHLVAGFLLLGIWTNYVQPISSSARSIAQLNTATGSISNRAAPPEESNAADARTASLSAGGQETQARTGEMYSQLPLRFEVNQGQTDEQVRFVSRGRDFNLFLTGTSAVMTLNRADVTAGDGNIPRVTPHDAPRGILRIGFEGANPIAKISGQQKLTGTSNYFIGNDPKQWRTNVSNYGRVEYESIYPGIDLIYYGNQRQIENDFVVAAGADPRAIQLEFEGARSLRTDRNGDLRIALHGWEVRQSKPFAYQDIEGQRQEIDARYVVKSKRHVGIEVGTYDLRYPLIIDPVLSYSSYLGGSGSDEAYSIAVDSVGNAYVAGVAFADFPTANPLQASRSGSTDGFITKLNSTGTAFVYSTYFGGSFEDRCNAIATDAAGNAYVTGYTKSSNFPTSNPLQPNNAGGSGTMDAFVAKLDPNGGTLLYSSYLGGSNTDRGNGIAVDASGNAFVMGTTFSTNFPTANAVQPTFGGSNDAFVAKLDPNGASLVYSTYLGGSGADYGENGIAVDSSGNAYVEGYTASTNFPIANAAQPTFGGGGFDAFITKLDSVGSTLMYSTYLGGPADDRAYGIAVDGSGNAYVAGLSNNSGFPVVNALQPTFAGYIDAFVAKLNPTGSAFVYATYLGGSGDDRASGIAVDSSGNAYVAGYTNSTNFPTAIPLQAAQADNGSYYDTFVTKLDPTGSALVFSSYLGGASDDKAFGIAVDSAGNAYVTGYTFATNFPTANPLQATLGGWNDAFVYKITGLLRYSIAGRVTDNTGAGLSAVTVTVSGSGSFTTQTDSNGYYNFASLAPGGNFTVTPSKTPYTFVPANRTFNNLSSDQIADFSILTYSISGRVTDSGGSGVEAVTIDVSGFQTGTAMTDAGGYYSFAAFAAGGNYTVTPSKSDPLLTYSFSPPSQSYSSLNANQTANFTASTSLLNTIYPTADAYVQDGSGASTNFGAVTPLKMQTDNHTNSGKNMDSYFMFDLSGVGKNITVAKLRIYAALSAAGSVSTSAYGVTNTSWIEVGTGSITWNNKPARNASAITGATVTVSGTSYVTYDLDVTSYVTTEKTAGRDLISLALHDPSTSTPFISVNSREAATNKPQL